MSEESILETAVRELRRMIFDGEIRAGQALRQDDLASRLGISRLPVREALNRLTAEGLVIFRPRQGYMVVALAPDEITEIFEMRMVLEEHAGRIATLKRDKAAIAKLKEILRRMDAIKGNDPDSIRLWCYYNREFHSHLFAVSGRRHLCRTIITLRDAVESYIRVSVAHMSLADAHEQHHMIFAAFRDGDADRVGKLCRQHCRHTAQSLLIRLRQAQRDSVNLGISPRSRRGTRRIGTRSVPSL